MKASDLFVQALEAEGVEYINPLPYSVRDVRYLDQPQLKPE